MAELIIAGIAPVKRKKGWFELDTRSKPPFLIDEETVIKSGLVVGGVISEAKWKRIKDEADLAWLKYRGMQVLSRRMISERDLRRKLSVEQKSPALLDQAMALMKRYGFYDDSKYAAAFVRSQMARGVKSKLYLKKKLWEKGIGEEFAKQAMASEIAEFDEISAVTALAGKKYRSLKNLPPDKARSRLINFLRGKGFVWDVIKEAADKAISEKEDYT
ncbi:MAG: RecX family transcriptional regulator [candidate division Zixibacteria bacterium]